MTGPRIGRRGLFGTASLAAFLASAPRAMAQVLGYPRCLEGPMVGAGGPDHIAIWARISGPFEVVVEASPDRYFKAPIASAPVRAGPETDFCVVCRVPGLRPATDYYYRLKIAGKADRYQPVPFKTRTAPAGPASFRVGFGSCCRIQFDADQKIFNAVVEQEPDLFFWLGDNIYGDTTEPSGLADLYRRQRSVERLLPLIRRVPNLAIWDDHDFGYNDSDRLSPVRDQSLALFKNYWANPSYGEPGVPGIHFKHSHGGVDFFFLDGRYHRDNSDARDTPAKTMLGAPQKRWLKAALKASTAPFKVLVSGTGWSIAEEGGDSWAVYRHERDELFDYIRDQKIEGVVLISGDTHMGELNCIPRSEKGGYDLYDFCSSPLAQIPDTDYLEQSPEVRMREVWGRSVCFGILDFQMGENPTLTLNLHNVVGAPVWDPLVLTPADLRNGASTWRAKIDPDELARRKPPA
ncbi:MAG TPA: alkaline phosphatase D family protein [Caulobacter sp.]|nr:alkaline phosphatase D family protein [Caulobacter sp.]